MSISERFLPFADQRPDVEDRSSSRSIQRCAAYPPEQGILAFGGRNEIGRDPLTAMLHYIIEVDIFNSYSLLIEGVLGSETPELLQLAGELHNHKILDELRNFFRANNLKAFYATAEKVLRVECGNPVVRSVIVGEQLISNRDQVD